MPLRPLFLAFFLLPVLCHSQSSTPQAAPALVDVSVERESNQLKLELRGTGFVKGAEVRIEGREFSKKMTSELIDSTHLRAQVPLPVPDLVSVSIRNPDGQISNAQPLVTMSPSKMIPIYLASVSSNSWGEPWNPLQPTEVSDTPPTSSASQTQDTGGLPADSSSKKENANDLKEKREKVEKETKKLEELLREKRKLQVAEARQNAIRLQLGESIEQPQTKSPRSSPSGNENPYCKFDNEDEKKFVRVRRAVLAPKEASDAFGRRLGKRFVVFQVTVENNSKDYQYMIHDVSVDLSRLLGRTAGTYAFSTRELSLLRGVPEKGQVYDPRNLSLKILRGVGTVAGAVSGLTAFEEVYGSAVAAYNGPFVNSFLDIFPDHTPNQLNRLSDSAYVANTVIGKKQARVFAVFVPQSLFLTSGEQGEFWKEPTKVLAWLDFREADVCVDGTFITEVTDLSPLVTAVVISSEEAQKFQKGGSEIKGMLTGTRFGGGKLSLTVDSPSDVTAEITNASSDSQAEFKLTIKQPIAPNTAINLTIHKDKLSGTASYSTAYKPQPPSLSALTLKSKTDKSATFTAAGTNFLPGDTFLNVFSKAVSPKAVSADGVSFEAEVALPSDYDTKKKYVATVTSKSLATTSSAVDVPAVK